MKHIVVLSCLLLFGIPFSAYGGQPDSEPVVILCHDGTGTINLDEIDTQPNQNANLST